MPELPEVETTRRRIAPAMVGAHFVAVDLRRPDLRAPFPKRFVKRLVGQVVVELTRRGKYLVGFLSTGESLLMHLGMSGSLRVARDAARQSRDPHDHVVFHMSSGKVVVFNDPRRFGLLDLVPAGHLERHATLSRLGPEPLSDEFDAARLAQACRGRKTSLKSALLDQRVVAGLGNIYASEALHVAGLSPRRRASTIATPSGVPRDAAFRLATAIKQVLERAIARQSARDAYRDSPFLVYEREGERCRTKDCRGTIRRRFEAGRSTFYCPLCQR
jgi:formamidopyrimidine-DNA glycosylase